MEPIANRIARALLVLSLAAPALDAQIVADERRSFLRYSIEELPDLGGPWHDVHVFDMNDRGEAVGYVLDPQLRWRAVRWDAQGAVHDLGGARGTWSIARGISESGVIGGFHGATLQTARPVLWINGNVVPLADPAQGAGVEVWDVDDSLAAVGRGHSTDSFAVLWSASGASALAAPYSYAFAINASGVAVGFETVGGFERAAQWHNGTTTLLPDLGLTGSKAIAINDAGTIVGHAPSPVDGLTHAVVWRNGAVVDLGSYLGTYITFATGINEGGFVVGAYYLDPLAEITRPLVWAPWGETRELGDLIPPGSGWTLSDAIEIDDSGRIVGHGTRAGLAGTRVFRARPR